MSWPEIFTQITLGVMGVLVSALGLVTTFLIHKYVKNNELKLIIGSLDALVINCVKEVYQTYVQELKDKNMFDKDAQKKALEMCLNKIQEMIPENVRNWLDTNFENVKEYLITLIESCIMTLKKEERK